MKIRRSCRDVFFFFNWLRSVPQTRCGTSLVPPITYILVIMIGWAVFQKMRFFDFSKFVHNFCKKNVSDLILGVNLSCNGSHSPSQYKSNSSGVTQTMLILLRPLNKIGQMVLEKFWLPISKCSFEMNVITPPFCNIFNYKLYGIFFSKCAKYFKK